MTEDGTTHLFDSQLTKVIIIPDLVNSCLRGGNDPCNSLQEEPVKQHKVMIGERILYQAAQLSHAENFAAARRSEGIDCYVVPDTTKNVREVRINPLTGKPGRRRREAGPHSERND